MSLCKKFYISFGLIACLAIGLAACGLIASSVTGNMVVRLVDEPVMAVNYARAASATLNQALGVMDRSLLLGPGASSTAAGSLVRAIISLGSSLRMNITAEGVETGEQLEFLVAAGCTELQGYLFSKPVPAGGLPALVKELSGRQESIEKAAKETLVRAGVCCHGNHVQDFD
jgi:hypothetical protein